MANFKQRQLWVLSALPLVAITTIIACAPQDTEVSSFNTADIKDLSFSANLKISLADLKAAQSSKKTENFVVGNFSASDFKTNLTYSFVDSTMDELFVIDNSAKEKWISLRHQQFDKVLAMQQGKVEFKAKAQLENQYILKTFSYEVLPIVESQTINIANDADQTRDPGQALKITEHFDVKINLDPATPTGPGPLVAAKNSASVRLLGGLDGNQITFYSPKIYSPLEQSIRTSAGLPNTPEIIFTSKKPEGVYLSTLMAYLSSAQLENDPNQALIGLTYETLDGKLINLQNIEKSRLDLNTTTDDAKDYLRSIFYLPINQLVKQVRFIFKNFDRSGGYAFLSNLDFFGKTLEVTQEAANKLLIDQNYQSYLTSEELSKTQNVNLVSGNKVTFNFVTPTKVQQIQLYKAPLGFSDTDHEQSPWKVRQSPFAQYSYWVKFADNTIVNFVVQGTRRSLEILTLPKQYQDKQISTITLEALGPLDLKEVVFV